MVVCMGPARGWGGPHSIGPRQAVLDAARAGVGFHRVVQEPMSDVGQKSFVPAVKH